MKIRCGFVSNSSSSSFVIDPSENKLLFTARKALGLNVCNITVNEVAAKMLEESCREKTLKSLLSEKHTYDYIAFGSINQPTEIFYRKIFSKEFNDDAILISTCSNEYISWAGALDKLCSRDKIQYNSFGDDGWYDLIETPYHQKFEKYFKEHEYNSKNLQTYLNYKSFKDDGYKVLVFHKYENGRETD